MKIKSKILIFALALFMISSWGANCINIGEANTNASGSVNGNALCGNNIVDPGEACDDGNTVTEASCPAGIASCTACDGTCQTTLNLSSGGNNAVCGNNMLETGEACDDGNTVSETSCPGGAASCTTCAANCLSTITLGTGGGTAVCGNNMLETGEACDDGNTVSETFCPGGAASCTTCAADCLSFITLGTGGGTGTGTCGDGVVNGIETCDDGNTLTEVCLYGQPNCTICNSFCQIVAGSVTGFCGDGNLNFANGENCDDSNTLSGDGCSNLCAYETGSYVTVSNAHMSNANKSTPAPAVQLWAATTLYETAGYTAEKVQLLPTGITGEYRGFVPFNSANATPRTIIVFDDVVVKPHPKNGTYGASLQKTRYYDPADFIKTDNVFSPCTGPTSGGISAGNLVQQANTVFGIYSAWWGTATTTPTLYGGMWSYNFKPVNYMNPVNNGFTTNGKAVTDINDELFTTIVNVSVNSAWAAPGSFTVGYTTFSKANAADFCSCQQSLRYPKNVYSNVPAHSTYVAGHSTYVPGHSTYVPGGSIYVTGGNTWVPGSNVYVPGGSVYIPGYVTPTSGFPVPGWWSPQPGTWVYNPGWWTPLPGSWQPSPGTWQWVVGAWQWIPGGMQWVAGTAQWIVQNVLANFNFTDTNIAPYFVGQQNNCPIR